ncbi:hypothetical protein KX816_17385 [Sphingosinicellaceae bacterium]|nr:hypothetical protein KX816_17385 [Sphingosinicellaceae bacterium]
MTSEIVDQTSAKPSRHASFIPIWRRVFDLKSVCPSLQSVNPTLVAYASAPSCQPEKVPLNQCKTLIICDNMIISARRLLQVRRIYCAGANEW